jgi:hypothetical protein
MAEWEFTYTGSHEDTIKHLREDGGHPDDFIGEPIAAAFGLESPDDIQGEALFQARQVAMVLAHLVNAVAADDARVTVTARGNGNAEHAGDEWLTIDVRPA